MTYQRNETPEPLASDTPAVSKKPFHPQADYVLDLLVAAGHITREKAFQARDIAVEFGPGAAPGAPGQEAADVLAAALQQVEEYARMNEELRAMADAAEAAQEAAAVQAVGATPEQALAMIEEYGLAVSKRDRMHVMSLGKAMTDQTYTTFATLRDDTIPALRKRLLAAIAGAGAGEKTS